MERKEMATPPPPPKKPEIVEIPKALATPLERKEMTISLPTPK